MHIKAILERSVETKQKTYLLVLQRTIVTWKPRLTTKFQFRFQSSVSLHFTAFLFCQTNRPKPKAALIDIFENNVTM